MKIILEGRGKGKTTELVKLSSESNATMVVLNPFMKEHAKGIAEDLGLIIPNPITYEELLSGRQSGRRMDINNFILDDIGVFLEEMVRENTSGGLIKCISISKEE